ncbi:hypothetical protein RFI_08017 [Reticulomyxa filosa]|uniref:GH16 domain-containing protein n=1 Tax=Reticulomyxa filosa TaxID=46433 RepID=X6NSX0_RETFI|nr:hypothetical protein RFI_08017 [Reticulomyxa filosa]|eukprot:ETO29111.1 hypothetical protein RFI_08017 [Reticulomyxa filosa]
MLNKGDWLWPAIWLLPVRNEYGDWPASGEIDIIEARANKQLTTSSSFVDGAQIGISQMTTTLHWGPYFGADNWALTHDQYTLANGDFSDAFHTWVLEWTPQGFAASVDNAVYFNVSTKDGYWSKGNYDMNQPGSFNPWMYGNIDAPFDKEFFIIINLAVGGVSG